MLVVCVILYATWLPGELEPSSLPKIPHIDKLIHAIMFGGLTGALLFDRRRSGRKNTLYGIFKFAAWVVAFAAFDEWMQDQLPIGRSSDVWDFRSDLIGILVAILIAPSVINAIFKNKN